MTKPTLSHDTLEMAKSYKYMVNSFANFGVTVSNASKYADFYLQNGISSAIHSENVGAKLKSIWDDNADSDFDNFIKNFDVWGAAMVESNNLAEDYKEQAASTYNKNQNNNDLGDPHIMPDDLNNVYGQSTGFGDGHGYISNEDIQKYRYDNDFQPSQLDYRGAATWSQNTAGYGKDEYFKAFDKLDPKLKSIVAQDNSEKAKQIYDTYGNNGSVALFHVLDTMNPGVRAAYEDLVNQGMK